MTGRRGYAPLVHAVRHLLARRPLAALICAATLLLKLLVPTGHMIDNASGHIAIAICSGFGPATTMMIDRPAMNGDMPDDGKSKDHGKAEMPCGFAGLSAAMTGAIDPIQLAALIVSILALGLVARLLPAPPPSVYLRPPLRGPPAYL